MKRITSKSLVAVALVAAMGISLPAVAFADSSTGSTNTSVTTSATAATSVWHSFHLAWKAYVDGLKSINATYRSSVDSARSAYLSARRRPPLRPTSGRVGDLRRGTRRGVERSRRRDYRGGRPAGATRWLQRHGVG